MNWKTETSLILSVRVVPGAQKTAFLEIFEESIKISVKAQPADNEANEALIKFLSKEFKTPQSHIKILSGEKSRNKIVSISEIRRIPDLFKRP